MLNLPIFQPAEIDSPAQMFRCDFYKATIAAGVCVARQKDTVSFARGGKGGRVSRARYEECASGRCAQGDTIAAALKDFKPENSEDARERKRQHHTDAGKAAVAAVEDRLAARPAAGEVAAAVEATRETKPAPPAREENAVRPNKLNEVSDDDFRAAHEAAGGSISALQKKFDVAWGTVRDRAKKVGLWKKGAALPAKKPRTVADVAKKHVVEQTLKGDEVVELLQKRRQHHLDQAERIGKALEALREVG